MWKWIFIVLLITLGTSAQAQRHSRRHSGKIKNEKQISPREKFYQSGVKYFNMGNYVMADSVFSKYIVHYSQDENALFSYAVTRLYLRDTVEFCKKMLSLYNDNQVVDAGKYYFMLCGTADTVFLNRRFQQCDHTKALYMVIKENHKYYDYQTVVVHKKGIKALSIGIGTGYTGVLKDNDIVAMYRLYPDGHKLFTVLLSDNEKNSDDKYDSFNESLEKDPIMQQAKKKLGLKDETVFLEYILTKTGQIKDVKITGYWKPLSQDKKKKLEKYIQILFNTAPQLNPMQFRKENVNYLVTTGISF